MLTFAERSSHRVVNQRRSSGELTSVLVGACDLIFALSVLPVEPHSSFTPEPLPAHRKWKSDWAVVTGAETDSEGWEYGFRWGNSWTSKESKRALVRRRRWQRAHTSADD
jgi:hypothetical protein